MAVKPTIIRMIEDQQDHNRGRNRFSHWKWVCTLAGESSRFGGWEFSLWLLGGWELSPC